MLYYYSFFSMEGPYDITKMLNLVTEVLSYEAFTELMFDYLIVIAPSKEQKMYLQKIIEDERQHYLELKKIYFSLTGQHAVGDAPSFQIPKSFESGIKEIFTQKLEMIMLYKRIRMIAPYLVIRERISEFIEDELRHLTILNYIKTVHNNSE